MCKIFNTKMIDETTGTNVYNKKYWLPLIVFGDKAFDVLMLYTAHTHDFTACDLKMNQVHPQCFIVKILKHLDLYPINVIRLPPFCPEV